MQEFITNSKEETQKIATDFAKSLKGGEILCFYGNLGAGKTTFIQALAKALGVKENVTSPTFVLMKQYRIKNQELGIMNFYHLDVYRLNSSQDAIDLGIEEIWSDSKNIIAIEWAEKISDILPARNASHTDAGGPPNKIDLCSKHIEGDKRKIIIFD